jgi:CheY-like chemotaxis protein
MKLKTTYKELETQNTIPKNKEKLKKKEIEKKEMCILIAEDEFINFLYLEALLENYKFKLIHAKNGDEAINLVKKNNDIDLILMDIKMPKINGLEATKEIRKSNKSIPILALTAYTSTEDKKNAIKAGCNDYITKPFYEKTIIEMVEKYSKGC